LIYVKHIVAVLVYTRGLKRAFLEAWKDSVSGIAIERCKSEVRFAPYYVDVPPRLRKHHGRLPYRDTFTWYKTDDDKLYNTDTSLPQWEEQEAVKLRKAQIKSKLASAYNYLTSTTYTSGTPDFNINYSNNDST
jgi:hypothetical protein